MPELPEVETTLRGIKPHLAEQKVTDVIVRHPTLRWPIPIDLKERMTGKKILDIVRRGKYLLFKFSNGTMILHLGMSGSVRVLTKTIPPKKHDHFDLCVSNKKYLRFTDPRRFGAILWTSDDPEQHELIMHIGVEPLTKAFNADYLLNRAEGRKVPIKSFIMDGKIVAGVGNIYAAEALFQAGIRPQTPAGKISRAEFQKLVTAIKEILKKAIAKGGTTLKDFTQPGGSPGYFSMRLQVYGRGGEACFVCSTKLKATRMGQRSTVYCGTCQK